MPVWGIHQYFIALKKLSNIDIINGYYTCLVQVFIFRL